MKMNPHSSNHSNNARISAPRRLICRIVPSLLLILDSIIAFSPQQPRPPSRYFTVETVLPPLSQINHNNKYEDNNNNNDNYNSKQNDDLNPHDYAFLYSTNTLEQSNILLNTVSDDTASTDDHQCLPVTYTNDPKTVSQWLEQHVPSCGCTLGFDVEAAPDLPWCKPPSFHGPAVVQLATADSALVIHLARSGGRGKKDRQSRACIPLLRSVLADESIVKAGCSIDQDMIELMEMDPSLVAQSRLDLGRLKLPSAHYPKNTNGPKTTPGLKTLSSSILGLELPKSRTIATSDWSHVPLNPSQLAYSARDAWVAAAVVEELKYRDPATFSNDALVRRLQSQKSMLDLYERHQKRKKAKYLLSTLLAPYQQQSQPQMSTAAKHNKKKRLSRRYPTHTMTIQDGWRAEMVRELKTILTAKIHDPAEPLDIRSLELPALAAVANGQNRTM